MMNISALANVLCREMAQNSSINKPPAGFSSGASDLCTYEKQKESYIGALQYKNSPYRFITDTLSWPIRDLSIL